MPRKKSLMDRIHRLQKQARQTTHQIKQLVQSQIDDHQSEITRLRDILDSLGTGVAGAVKRGRKKIKGWLHTSAPTKQRARKQIRRSREDLEKAAKEAVEVIRGKGKDGAAAADLKKFGIIGSPKKWFAQYVPQAKVKMRGQKAKARHFVD